MNRLKLCLILALSVSVVQAQKPSVPDDGGLKTLGEDPEEGPKRVSRIENQLLRGEYDKLDATAARLRTEKTRAPGGAWVLRTFYEQLNPKEMDEQVLAVRRQKFEDWIKQKPESITARVALANFYVSWAWVARGSSESDKVPESEWPVFFERIKKAEGILHDAIQVKEKCPEWYGELLVVAKAAEWDAARTKTLYEQAIQFEPDYPSFYTRYAEYLLPKWEGSVQDSLKFIKDAADKRGGDAGDIVYFQIATVMVTRNNGKFHPELNWEKLQRGHAALETAYGAASGERNHYALMAVRFKDAPVAKKEFAEIGDKWSRSVWKNKAAFEKAKEWAEKNGPA